MISIVTPNYNGGRWLGDCLESVASQTLSQDQIEMVFIDDGSTDNSQAITEKFHERIPGLKTIWNSHTGNPGEMRNIGIEEASGEHILFLDSDDYIGEDSLTRLSEFSQVAESDIIAFQLTGLNRNVPKSMLNKTIIDADIVLSGLYKSLGTWKMCNKEYLDDRGLRFKTHQQRGEDALFFSEAMLKASKVSILSGYPFYTLRGREDGTSITQKEWVPKARIDLAKRLATMAVDLAASDNIANHFLIRVFNTEALGVIGNSMVTEDDLTKLQKELQPYWSKSVCDLIYTDFARGRLIDFFGVPTE